MFLLEAENLPLVINESEIGGGLSAGWKYRARSCPTAGEPRILIRLGIVYTGRQL